MSRGTIHFRGVTITLIYFSLHFFSVTFDAILFDALESRLEVFAVRI
jgi:hypothetical protein